MSHQAFYSKLFTPPKFLQMPAVSVEILSAGIYFLTTKKTESGLIPDKFGLVSLEAGAVVHGEIVKKEAVIKALIEIRKKTGETFVRCSIPEEKTYIFKTHLPTLESKEIHDILDFKLEENIPLSSKEAVFDYDLVPTQKSGQGNDIVVSAASLKMIEDWQAVFQAAGLTSIIFSPEANNIAKALVHPSNEQVLVIANIRESNIILSLVVCGVVYQTSSINFGSSTFNDLLAKYYKVSPSEVLKLKKEKLYVERADSLEVFSYIINTVSAIKDEIYKFISYSNEREDLKNKVEKIILVGPDACIVGLVKYLSSNLNLPVEIGNIWLNNFKFDDYIPDLNQVESLNYGAVSGLNLF